MNKIIIVTTLFLISFISLAQVSENREVANFSKLKASNGIQVLYTISNTNSIIVETDDQEKMKYIKTEVVGETLKLYVENDDYSQKSRKNEKRTWTNNIKFKVLKITVSGPNLDEIKASSSAYVKIQNVNKSKSILLTMSSSATLKGNFETEMATVDASSSGTFSGDIAANNIAIETSSSSDVTVEGKADNITVKASSSGDCNAKELKAENATVMASSSASISVFASNSVTAKASSSGSISFYGNPTNVSKEMSSSGSVSKK
jgi:hypothetical protein